MVSDRDDRTEPLSERRRRALRERGLVPVSGELTTAVLMLVAVGSFQFFGGDLCAALGEAMLHGLTGPPASRFDAESARNLAGTLGGRVAGPLLAIATLAPLAAWAAHLAQTRFLLTTERLWPDLGRISPAAGWARLLSPEAPARIAAAALKLLVLSAIAAGFVSDRWPELAAGGALAPEEFGRQAGGWLLALGLRMALGMAALAGLDLAWQRWRFDRAHRMTKQEVRDELRESEGDPTARRQRREAHRRRVAARQAG